jgi:hemolysin activation/secretion protein
LKNFQATLFTDFGTVWNKRNPFEKQNDFNTKPIENSLPFSGQVTDFKSPILASYGLGARTSILGYFVKLDFAWGIDDGETLKPVTYFTLGYDF